MTNKQFPPPSDEFMRAVCYSVSGVINCELCGRVHFASEKGGFDWEEGEYEDLIKKNEKNPDEYFCHNDEDAVSWGRLDEKQVVYGCPCNLASRYEQLFWKSRHIIRDYLNAKAKKIQEFAKNESGLAKDVNNSLNSLK